MKKKLIIALMIISAVSLLSGCCAVHKWVEATCTTPKTCEKCGAVKGEAQGHKWIEATCTEAKHCEVCKETEGQALGHTWVEATCTEKAYCKICNETTGEPLGHDFVPASLTAPRHCKNCSIEEGKPLSVTTINFDYADKYDRVYLYKEKTLAVSKGKKKLTFDYISADGEILSSVSVSLGKHNWSYSVFQNEEFSACAVIGTSDSNSNLTLYDWEGNVSGSTVISFANTAPSYAECSIEADADGKEYLLIKNPKNDKALMALDLHSLEVVDLSKINISEVSVAEFLSDYKYYEYCEAINGYLVSDESANLWSYFDKEGAVINSYADATVFSASGYAFVSEDGSHYTLIDKDFNILEKDYLTAEAVSFISMTDIYAVIKDGSAEYYLLSSDS